METDRMAALGFSVLMREWRRGMAFDPWHGSLYLNLSVAITLSSSFFCSYRWGERAAPQSNYDQDLKSSSRFHYQWDAPGIIADWSPSGERKGNRNRTVKILFYLQSFTMSRAHGHHAPVSYHVFVQTTRESHGSSRTFYNSCSLTPSQRR